MSTFYLKNKRWKETGNVTHNLGKKAPNGSNSGVDVEFNRQRLQSSYYKHVQVIQGKYANND